MNKVRTYTDSDPMMWEAALWVSENMRERLNEQDRFNLALSGSFGLLDLYRQLPAASSEVGVDWEDVYVFWVDERCVPADDPANHYRMIHTNFLAEVPIPESNILPIKCEDEPKQESEEYESLLRGHFYGQDWPQFDLIILGVGEDGHVASLFPGSEALHEEDRWVVADFLVDLGEWRLTLTPAVINRSRSILIMAEGKEKSEAVQRGVLKKGERQKWPVTMVEPSGGEVVWFLDEAAGLMLEGEAF